MMGEIQMANTNDKHSQQSCNRDDWQVRLDFGVREQQIRESHDDHHNVRVSTYEVMP